MTDQPSILRAPQPMEVRIGISPPRDPGNPHIYPGAPGYNPNNPLDCYTSNCINNCGCYAGPSTSGGPKGIDPWGECPNKLE